MYSLRTSRFGNNLEVKLLFDGETIEHSETKELTLNEYNALVTLWITNRLDIVEFFRAN